MSNTKTTNAPARRRAGQQSPAQAQQRAGAPATVDQAIARAQQGRVNVTPDKAVQMAVKLYGEGKLVQAERVCRQIIGARPDNADAHNILGVSLHGQGKGEEAITELRRAVKLAPHAASLRANLGEVLRQNGKLDEAAKESEKAVEIDPKNAQALNNLGIIQYEKRKFEEAVELLPQGAGSAPEHGRGAEQPRQCLAGHWRRRRCGRRLSGRSHHREIYPEAYNNLGTLLHQDNKPQEAEHALRKAIAQNPRYIEAYNNLATLLTSEKKDVDALRLLGDALKFAPKNVQTLLITAKIQMRRNNHSAAEQAARLALQEQPDNAEALTILGQVLHETDRYDESITVLERAVKANPNNPEALNFYGVALKSVGRLDEARDHIVNALKMNSGMWGAYANLNDLVDFSKDVGAELFDQMDTIFESAKNTEAGPFLPLHFAYGKALEDRGEHERALKHYITGGKMKRAQLDYNEAETFGFFDAIRETFTKEFLENRKYEGLDDERPVFIIGMPRSGSTLVEQILSSHPEIYGAGEVKYLSRALGQLRDRFPSLQKFPMMMDKITPGQLDILAKKYLEALSAGAGDAKRITDKLLTNYFFVGLIHFSIRRRSS
jgi:Flp pilus assembly protein TadD